MGAVLLVQSFVISSLSSSEAVILPWGKSGTFLQVLALVNKYIPERPVILEAGAFDGVDTVRMKNFWPKSIIHTFEPDPENFLKLKKNTAGIEGIYCYEMALSNVDGKAFFNRSDDPARPDNRQSGSLLAPKEHLTYSGVVFAEKVEVATLTLDSWAKLYSVSGVDFLWLDMQGFELTALKAAPNFLKQVKVIFTEVEFVEAYAGQALYPEVRKWLEDQGFILLAKDFNDGDKKRWYGNILMVRP